MWVNMLHVLFHVTNCLVTRNLLLQPWTNNTVSQCYGISPIGYFCARVFACCPDTVFKNKFSHCTKINKIVQNIFGNMFQFNFDFKFRSGDWLRKRPWNEFSLEMDDSVSTHRLSKSSLLRNISIADWTLSTLPGICGWSWPGNH